MDNKRRLTVPARFAKALTPRAQRTFVAVHGTERCLTLYPLDYWQLLEKHLPTTPWADANARMALRRLLAYAEDLPLDNQNRITLSPGLLEHAHLNRDVLLIGLSSHLEIWDPAHWKEVMDSPGVPSFEEVFTRLDESLQKAALEYGERHLGDAAEEGKQ